MSDDNDNEVLDRIIKNRYSTRCFTVEKPAKELIEKVIEAGRLAPFAGLPNIGTTDFRRFFVISQNSETIAQLRKIIVNHSKETLQRLGNETNPRMQAMINALRAQVQNGPRVGNAPWLVVVAERRGFPEREEHALAHCLQNMWLKATALGLGFQLTSVIRDLGDNQQLSEIFGLTNGEFCYDGCIIGYSATSFPENKPVPRSLVSWID